MTLTVLPKSPAPAKKSRPGRKTDIEREEIQFEAQQRRKALEQRAKRAEPMDPLRAGVLFVALGIAIVILATSGVFSFATIVATAAWMMPAWDWLVWIVPGFVELFIVFFGVDAIVSQARGKKRDSNWALFWMLVFSGVAVLGNAAHTIAEWGDLSDWRAWIGTLFSALAPLGVVLITKRVSRLVFADPDNA